MPLTIRPYQPDDAHPTWLTYFEAIHQTAAKDYAPAELAAWAPEAVDLAEWHTRRAAARTFVALIDNQVIGFTDLTAAGLVDMLFVHPTASGRGVARALLETVITEARTLNLRTLHTHASRTARPTFERLGFQVTRENNQNWIRGQNLPNYDMHLTLTENFTLPAP